MEEKIIAYLRGDLSPAEKAAFEERLKADSDLKKELGFTRQLMEGIKEHEYENTLAFVKKLDRQIQVERARISRIRKQIALLGIFLLLLISGVWFCFFREKPAVDLPIEQKANNAAGSAIIVIDTILSIDSLKMLESRKYEREPRRLQNPETDLTDTVMLKTTKEGVDADSVIIADKKEAAPPPGNQNNIPQAIERSNPGWVDWKFTNPVLDRGGKLLYVAHVNKEKFGNLYTWETAVKVCPEGYRIPSEFEWMQFAYLFMKERERLREIRGSRTVLMDVDRDSVIVIHGAAIPLGGRYDPVAKQVVHIGKAGYYWSTSRDDPGGTVGFGFSKEGAFIYIPSARNGYAFSVKCIPSETNIEQYAAIDFQDQDPSASAEFAKIFIRSNEKSRLADFVFDSLSSGTADTFVDRNLKDSERPNEPSLEEVIEEINLHMVRVEGGTFLMGCTENCRENATPVHQVNISGFWISKYELTQKQWRAIMGADPPGLNFPGCDNCPVEGVSWNDAKEFIKKLNSFSEKKYRLPSEAEWEFAAKGGVKSEGYKFAGSNEAEDVAWTRENSSGITHPVGLKPANELGVYDMSGNVWEWCLDCRNNNYQGAPRDGSAWQEGDCSQRVLRGGNFQFGNENSRVSGRFSDHLESRSDHFVSGFRLARD